MEWELKKNCFALIYYLPTHLMTNMYYGLKRGKKYVQFYFKFKNRPVAVQKGLHHNATKLFCTARGVSIFSDNILKIHPLRWKKNLYHKNWCKNFNSLWLGAAAISVVAVKIWKAVFMSQVFWSFSVNSTFRTKSIVLSNTCPKLSSSSAWVLSSFIIFSWNWTTWSGKRG